MIDGVPADRPLPVVLSIAGSDSGGGAGIQADLKAFARAGVHGATAITAITAQNTIGVQAVGVVAPALVQAQARAVIGDLGVDAVKIGMLGDGATIEAVAQVLDELAPGTPIVHDPVMIAESGARLLAPEALATLVELIVPRATVLTPNLPEARTLVGAEDLDGEELLRAVHALGCAHVVVTGGHREEAVDLHFDGETFTSVPGERFPDGAAHGSGCTHASTLAAQLALGLTPLQAARVARCVAGEAVRDGLRGLGSGPGPVDVLGLRGRRARQAPAPAPTRVSARAALA
ncbi:MAG: bifunctional hydroxymethylpyrimidine kinase/phosphomethylpyrimidine kinase [Solirubrobacterales bacterium]|nr:bifunctional hydroxymethylpyrimidine kinase/phosphomethylpyrimidine kinase [Solirubrobacterales bacterium]